MEVDGLRALSIGSPFGQSYVDSHGHVVDAPMRGDSDDFPKHDVGFVAKGEVVRTIHNTLARLWDVDAPANNKFPDWSHGDPVLPDDDWDAVCSIQIVRTLSAHRFPDLKDGEKGILEAYLRAFASAEDFIYLENQYFTNNAIADALVNAMNHNPQLQTILLVNIQPDMPFYPWKQRRLIHCIRTGIKTNPDRFGVFTRWSHQVVTPLSIDPRPQLVPVYIHSKVGVVDDKWCTVGSANLDGLSIDSFLLNPFVKQRAIELNAIMLNGGDAPASEAPDILRRKLWAEHLGYFDSSGQPDINHADLVKRIRPAKRSDGSSDGSSGWLQLWTNRAKGTLSGLVNDPTQPLASGSVLPWPPDNTTHKTPRDYLETLGIQTHPTVQDDGTVDWRAVVPLKGTRAFDFKSGDWNNKAAMDYD
jgi:phosphatidylserine/phosphatidylglycerophosphate/cardiolipin synthase-like enzyme